MDIKILLLGFKAVNVQAHVYIFDLLTSYDPDHCQVSSSRPLLPINVDLTGLYCFLLKTHLNFCGWFSASLFEIFCLLSVLVVKHWLTNFFLKGAVQIIILFFNSKIE